MKKEEKNSLKIAKIGFYGVVLAALIGGIFTYVSNNNSQTDNSRHTNLSSGNNGTSVYVEKGGTASIGATTKDILKV